jgi:Glycosyltransferase family 92
MMNLAYLGRYLTDSRFRVAQRYLLPPSSEKPKKGVGGYYLTTATIVKNEARFLREFAAFHRLAGVDHMLIYDDESEDDITKALHPFIETGFVELIPWPRFQKGRNGQFAAYQHALAYMRDKSFWLAMMDCDEFLFSPSNPSLKEQLQKRESFPALGVYSRTFGTSGLDEIAEGSLILECLTKRPPNEFKKNCTQRTIVQPKHALAVRSANTVLLDSTRILGWDESGVEILATGETGHPANELRINHYFTRARGDFERKIARQYFGKKKWQQKMDLKHSEAGELDAEVVTDTDIQKFLPELRKALCALQA